MEAARVAALRGHEVVLYERGYELGGALPLAAMVKAGTFREDLYYRLRVLPLQVPPLREREHDVPFLANQLLGNLVQRYKRSDVSVSQEALDLLEAHDWPGNVRELLNVLEYALVQTDGDTILPRHLPPELQAARAPAPVRETSIAVEAPLTRYYHPPRAPEDEKAAIQRTLREAGGNKAQAAKILGMSRTTLWKRLKEYGLD